MSSLDTKSKEVSAMRITHSTHRGSVLYTKGT